MLTMWFFYDVMCLPGELQLIRKLKVYETIQAPNHATKTTKLPAVPFTFIGNTCNKKSIFSLLVYAKSLAKPLNFLVLYMSNDNIPQTSSPKELIPTQLKMLLCRSVYKKKIWDIFMLKHYFEYK